MHFKYALSRSAAVLVINAVVGVVLIICITNLYNAVGQATRAPDSLTDSYYRFNIVPQADSTLGGDLKALVRTVDAASAPCMLLSKDDRRMSGVYANSGYLPAPKMLEGRMLNLSDLRSVSPCMDVSESLLGACRQVKGKRYYFYNGLAYQVIGVFRSGRDSIEPDSLGYYNLVATCQTANSNQLTSKFSTDADEAGLYWVDAGSQTQAFVSALNTTEHLKVTSSPAKRTFAHIIKLALSQQKGSIGLMAFTFFLMLVNVLVLLYAWLYRKRRETWIRRLNGASRIRLTWLLLAEYLFIVTLAFAVAVVIAVCLAAIPASPLFLFPGLGWQAIFIAYLGIIVVSLVSAAPVILAYLSRTRSIQMIGARG